ncbi:MAG: sialate O-acetylesterase, partial [Planctomycetota bacterium]
MKPIKPFLSLIAFALLLAPSITAAELSLGSLFQDHVVLQRDMAVPVWGTAEAGQSVAIEFAGQSKQATADDQGKWVIKLDAMPASAEGRTLTVSAGDATAKVADVLVGEVWICSGQSNMAFGLAGSVNGKEAIEAAGDAQLRLFNAGARAVDEPQATIGGTWQVDSPQSAGSFSAVGYFFGKHLREHVGVPVG